MKSPKPLKLNSWRSHGQKGLTIPILALIVVTLFVFAALAVDLGVAYTARTTAQHAADAAALAGAYTWQKRADLSGAERVEVAFRDGAAVGNAYKVLGKQVLIDKSDASYAACLAADNIICVDEAKRRVTAVVAVPVETYFGKILVDLLKVRAIANAEAAPNAAGETCIKPMFLSNDAISNVPLNATGPGGKASNQDYKNKCDAAYANNSVIFNDNGDITKWANDYIAQQQYATSKISDPTSCVGAGCPIPLITNDTSPNPSQVGIVDFSEGQGNGAYDLALVACAMGGCLQECPGAKKMFECSDTSVGIKTGLTWGQVDDLGPVIDNASNQYVDLGQYRNADGVLSDSSHSVVSVIVWDCRQMPVNGTVSNAKIMGLAKIFINKLAQKNTNAFLISAGSCGSGVSEAGGGAIPIRLVNVDQ